MTAHILANELALLLQEAKKRSGDLRAATEKSLAEVKALSSYPEPEVARELSQKPTFPSPFILACTSKTSKLVALGVGSLQRLIVAKALAQSRLKEVLDVFRDALTQGPDIQLKILQALPSLLQNYASDIQGRQLEDTLTICSSLQGTKISVINSTAAATLQQLIISVFDKVSAEDDKSADIATSEEVSIDGENIALRPAAADAYRIFQDLCLQTEGQRPQHVQFTQIPQTFGLELIESILSNHSDLFLTHPEQAHVVRARVAPFMIRSLSNKANFPIAVRVIRVFYVLLRRHLPILESECEVALGLLIHMLEPDSAPTWKRALCMEVVKGVFSEASLIRRLYTVYDSRREKKPVLQELTSMLARLAMEKTSVIGLGTHSSITLDQNALKSMSNDQLALEAGGVAGIIGGVGIGDAAPPGLSSQWSSIRVPCIEQLDKTEPPSTPESYLYALVLNCLNSFSEGLAKFVLPISTPSTEVKGSRKKRLRVPARGHDSDATSGGEASGGGITRRVSGKRRGHDVLNPLVLENHPLISEIKISASIVDSCWAAVLALYSTFLNATLDSEYYHGLVRSLQKFTQVAGVFELSTPRDTFLTTLGKAAVPPQVLSSHIASVGHYDGPSRGGEAQGTEKPVNLAVPQVEQKPLSLNIRNLTCLRALLNVGTALGATLQESWTIILEALQQTDYILQSTYRASTKSSSQSIRSFDSQRSQDSQPALSNVGPEISAVEATTQRLFESTKDFNNEAFLSFLKALCDLLDLDSLEIVAPLPTDKKNQKPTMPVLPGSHPGFGHRRVTSVSNRRKSSSASTIDNTFVISKLGELVQLNIERLITDQPSSNGWDVVLHYLLQASTSRGVEAPIRLKAADILHDLVVSAARTLDPEDLNAAATQERILGSLLKELEALNYTESGIIDASNKVKLVDADIHKGALETLTTMLEQSGENLKSGWSILFSIMNTAFKQQPKGVPLQPTGRSIRLLKTSFASLQLICTDFLGLLPIDCVLVLIDTLYSFCAQVDDLNVSLTTITYFWNISDFLQRQDLDGTTENDFPSNDKELLAAVASQGSGTSMVLWLILLLRLAEITKDSRAEVRNGSIQTLFRIFDSYGHTLGPKAWNSCLNIVIFKMMSTTEALLGDEAISTSERHQWDETVVLILKGTGNLYTNFLHMYQLQSSFETIWSTYIQYLRRLLDWKSAEVTKTVYKELAKLLEKATASDEISVRSKREVWDLWALQGVSIVDGMTGATQNSSQETLTAFVDAFRPLYKLMGPITTTDDVGRALDVLCECILFPELPAYFFDVESLSALQSSVLDSIRVISTESTTWTTLILKKLALASKLPYMTKKIKGDNKRAPSYVAVSSTILNLIANLTLKHAKSSSDVYDSGAITDVLEALSTPIRLKYEFTTGVTTKKDALWIQATKVALQILSQLVPLLDVVDCTDDIKIAIWEKIVDIISAVVSAKCEEEDVNIVFRDEELDISFFNSLRALVIPRLGRYFIPTQLVERYVESIFNSSLLYKVEDGELEISFKDTEIATDPLFGCTDDPFLERRSRMSYVCLNELFELCRKRDEGAEWHSLATATIPYMLLRVSIVLRRFAADQPLRGKTPQPRCQRKEILYVMKCFTDLDCESSSLDQDTDSETNQKRHLRIMFPFVSQAIRVASGDPELLRQLTLALNGIRMP